MIPIIVNTRTARAYGPFGSMQKSASEPGSIQDLDQLIKIICKWKKEFQSVRETPAQIIILNQKDVVLMGPNWIMRIQEQTELKVAQTSEEDRMILPCECGYMFALDVIH